LVVSYLFWENSREKVERKIYFALLHLPFSFNLYSLPREAFRGCLRSIRSPPAPLNKGGEVSESPLNKEGEVSESPLNKEGEVSESPPF
jgi:hypothetical protein